MAATSSQKKIPAGFKSNVATPKKNLFSVTMHTSSRRSKKNCSTQKHSSRTTKNWSVVLFGSLARGRSGFQADPGVVRGWEQTLLWPRSRSLRQPCSPSRKWGRRSSGPTPEACWIDRLHRFQPQLFERAAGCPDPRLWPPGCTKLSACSCCWCCCCEMWCVFVRLGKEEKIQVWVVCR